MDPAPAISRLHSTAPSIRRLAILDLIRLSPAIPAATEALLRHLPREPQEKSALAIIRHLAAAGIQHARPTLWQLAQDPATAVSIAHAALLAHDQLLALHEAPDHSPLECPDGKHGGGEHHDQTGPAA